MSAFLIWAVHAPASLALNTMPCGIQRISGRFREDTPLMNLDKRQLLCIWTGDKCYAFGQETNVMHFPRTEKQFVGLQREAQFIY